MKILSRCWLSTLQSPVLHQKCQSWASCWGSATSLCDVHTYTALGLPASGVGARGKGNWVAASSLAHCFLLCSKSKNCSALSELVQRPKLRNLKLPTAQKLLCQIIPVLYCHHIITIMLMETFVPQKIVNELLTRILFPYVILCNM